MVGYLLHLMGVYEETLLSFQMCSSFHVTKDLYLRGHPQESVRLMLHGVERPQLAKVLGNNFNLLHFLINLSFKTSFLWY